VLLIAYMCPYSLEINISSSFFPAHSGKETVENLKISRGQLAPCQENRIKRQQTVSSAGCKVLVPNAGFLLASMPSYCRFKPIECSYSESVSVSVPQDKIRGSAILGQQDRLYEDSVVPHCKVTRFKICERTVLRYLLPAAIATILSCS